MKYVIEIEEMTGAGSKWTELSSHRSLGAAEDKLLSLKEHGYEDYHLRMRTEDKIL